MKRKTISKKMYIDYDEDLFAVCSLLFTA